MRFYDRAASEYGKYSRRSKSGYPGAMAGKSIVETSRLMSRDLDLLRDELEKGGVAARQLSMKRRDAHIRHD
jgi:hypothetical protein